MAKAKRPKRLKVFSANLGFVRAIVAVPSQKAALEAWGTSRNLFAEGLAAPENDPSLQAEAQAHPGEVIRKPLSDEAGYVAAAKAPSTVTSSPKAARQRIERSRLDAAEAAVTAQETKLADELSALDEERSRLDEQVRQTKLTAEKRLVKLRSERDAAEAEFCKAGE